jgi:hypothetical protein
MGPDPGGGGGGLADICRARLGRDCPESGGWSYLMRSMCRSGEPSLVSMDGPQGTRETVG